MTDEIMNSPIAASARYLRDLCEKCQFLLLGVRSDDPDLRSYLHFAAEDIAMIKGMLDESPLIVFCGKTNVGKSTLLNALLGEKVAPIFNGDWSSRPVEYRYSETPLIFMADTYPPKKIKFHSDEELYDALTQLSTMSSPDQSLGKQHMVVELDSPVLKDGLILCDMPGFLATDGNTEETGTHDDDVCRYLDRQKSLHVFLVSNANLPNESVIKFVRNNFASVHLSMVINYRKNDNIDDRKEALENEWRNLLNRPLAFHYINAKKAKEDPTEREALLAHLKQYSFADGRREIAERDLCRVFRDVELFLRDFHHIKNVSSCFWNTRLNCVMELVQRSNNAELLKTFEKFRRNQ